MYKSASELTQVLMCPLTIWVDIKGFEVFLTNSFHGQGICPKRGLAFNCDKP